MFIYLKGNQNDDYPFFYKNIESILIELKSNCKINY